MVKLKAGKGVLPRKSAAATARLSVIITHRERCGTWWQGLRVMVTRMPEAPAKFWNAVLDNRVVPVDERAVPSILADARGWPGWQDEDGPLEPRLLAAPEVDALVAEHESRGERAAANALRDFARRAALR